MSIGILFHLLLFIGIVASIKIPFVRDVILKPLYSSNSIIIPDRTCEQCLCMSNSSHIALNWFPNNTCQFFYTFPSTYQTQVIPSARLYFLKQIYPNASQCCMPSISSLLNKLKTAVRTYANVSKPHCLVLDNYGYLVTISKTSNSIVRFYSRNLTAVRQPLPPTFSSTPLSLAYYNEAYYVGFQQFILVVNSKNLTILHNITTNLLRGTRDMIFLNDGQVMLVVSTDNNLLLFFQQLSTALTNYIFVRQQPVSYSNPHGMRYINDTNFYVTSWKDNAIYSYSLQTNGGGWSEKLVFNVKSVAPASSGNHLTIDECGRYWFSLDSYGVLIFNGQGALLGNLTQPNSVIFDTIIANNYVVYLSDTQSNRIIRTDPNIQC